MEPTHHRPTRATAWGGIAFAVLYVAGLMTMLAGTPDTTDLDTNREWTAAYVKYYSDSGNRTSALIGAYLLGLACLAVVVFGAHLRDRLAAVGSHTSGRIAFAGSIMLAILSFTGAFAIVWLPGAIGFGDAPLPKGEIAYFSAQLGFGAILVGGAFGAALMLVATGIGSARTGALPRWLAWAGIVVAVIVGPLGAFFMPMVLLVLWFLVAGIVGLRRPFADEVAAA